jgi:hypothetical protein
VVRTDVLLQVSLADGRSIRAVLQHDADRFRIPTPEQRSNVFGSYVWLGIEHILTGFDHLLFVFCLLLLVGARTKPLLRTITAFTIGHSITLSLAALQILTLPQAPTEALIALSIFFLAIELVREKGDKTLTQRYPWLVSLLFGLLHGLGFAGALAEIGLPAGFIPTALAAFNIGVELGQLTFVAAMIALGLLLRRAVAGTRSALALKAAAYAAGSCAAFWSIERISSLF